MRCWLALLLALPAATAFGQFGDITIQLSVRGQTHEGAAFLAPDNQVHLLSRDGRLLSFSAHEATDYRKTLDKFSAFSHRDLRAGLLREYGRGFDVTGTGNYLVVHPVGQRDKWAPRFDELYRSFFHYFAARGFPLSAPKFPMVAVVCASQADFMRLAAKDGASRDFQNMLGYYSPISNRILLYDSSSGSSATTDWQTNAETLIHEAAHQTAFNTNLHSRYVMPPRWVVEGLGTMFEARGVWNSLNFQKRADRINSARLTAFKADSKRRQPGFISEMLSSDRLFQTDLDRAYAEAWAVSFFIAESEPKKYVEFLRKTTNHTPFVTVTPQDRLKDFTDIFGSNLAALEARCLRFLSDI